MKPKKRQKLCYHCEGEVDLDVIVCPFCAADLREERPEFSFGSQAAVAKVLGDEEESHFPSDDKDHFAKEESKERGGGLLASLFFTAGIQLLFFGLFSLLFSRENMIVLSWDASYWFLYCLIGGPLLYFGYRQLS